MKFRTALLGLLALLSTAHAQQQPRPIYATDIYNGAGHFYIPSSTPLAGFVAQFDQSNTITNAAVSNLELSYLLGARSNLQAQIDAVTTGAVLSVFGRTGNVTAQLGDYSSFFLQKSLNLSDLASPATARTNLGLGSAATHPSTDFDAAGAAAAAQTAAIAASDPVGSAAAAQAASLQKSANLSDVQSASTARTNLGLGAAATQPLSAFLQPGNNLSELSSPSTARSNLGLGSAAIQPSTAFDPAGSATTALAAALLKANNLSDLLSPSTARLNLGLGSAATHAASDFDAAGAAAAAQAAAIAASDPVGSAAAVQALALLKANNLSDIPNKPTARTNLGLGSAATQSSTAFDPAGTAASVQAASLQKSANLSDLVSPSTARTNLGLGSAAIHAATDFDAAGAAAAAQAAAQAASDPLGSAATVQAVSLQKSANLSDLASAATARANLGLGSAAVQPTSAFSPPLTFINSLTKSSNTVQLVNDAPNPGAFQVYGTDGFGLKGWFPAGGAFPGTGTVTDFLFTNANGFQGSVITATTTPTLTLSTSLADGMLKSVGGALVDAVPGTDYQTPLTPGNISTSTTGVTVGNGTGSTVGPNVTVDVQTATALQPGLLSAADWATFNGKQNALSFGNLTDTGTDGITVTGGTGAVVGAGAALSQHVADSTHNGYLSSGDWSLFNSKQSALTFSSSLVNSAGTVTLVNDSASPGATKYYGTDGSGTRGFFSIPATGVTSVALALPAEFTVTGSPVTSTGTLTGAWASETALTVFAAPTSTGTPGFRLIDHTYISDFITAAQAVFSLGAFGSTPSANGAVYSAGVLTLEPADATHPGGVTTGAQTFAGTKTFSSTISGSINGNAATATALAANPTDCAANQYANAIDAGANLTCSQVTYAQISGTPTLYYQTVVSIGVGSMTQRPNLGFSSAFTLTDNSGASETDIDLATNGVLLSKLQALNPTVFLGNSSGSPGNVSQLSATTATSMLNSFVGDSGSGGTKGLVPAPAAGDAAAGKVLGAGGTWITPSAGGGGVTNVVVSSNTTHSISANNKKGIIVTATSTQTLPDCTSTGPWDAHITNMIAGVGAVTVAAGGSNTFSDGIVSGQTSYQITDPAAYIWVECTGANTLYVTQ